MKNKNNKTTLRLTMLSLFTAFAVILSYIEFLIPFSYGYGLKIGLANIMIISVLYVFSYKEAFMINFARILIIGLLFGNFLSIIFSLAGSIFSITIMTFLKKIKGINRITVSVFGGVFHNIGQVVIAFLVLDTFGIFYYIPVLIIGGIVTGIIVGIISGVIIKFFKENFKYDIIC